MIPFIAPMEYRHVYQSVKVIDLSSARKSSVERMTKERIQEERLRRGLSIQALAKLASCDATMLAQFEQGVIVELGSSESFRVQKVLSKKRYASP